MSSQPADKASGSFEMSSGPSERSSQASQISSESSKKISRKKTPQLVVKITHDETTRPLDKISGEKKPRLVLKISREKTLEPPEKISRLTTQSPEKTPRSLELSSQASEKAKVWQTEHTEPPAPEMTEQPLYPIDLWNQFEAVLNGWARTNNSSEGKKLDILN